jgi:hypothetical protein
MVDHASVGVMLMQAPDESACASSKVQATLWPKLIASKRESAEFPEHPRDPLAE